ncbi:MAG: adenosine-specific kinase [Candidatus Micrarchaeia archaeon]
MEIKTVKIENEGNNFILGHAHFIKTVEDLYEAVITSCPNAKFGIAFSEASGKCLIRVEGNDESLKKLAARNLEKLKAGHTFIIIMKEAYPISMLNAVKNIQEVCEVFCATANETDVIVAENERGCGILGVIDGSMPKGVEGNEDAKARKEFLRKIGYKL